MRFTLLIIFCLVTGRTDCFSIESKNSFILDEDKIYSSTECYIIRKQLGEGSFGKVFAVEDSKKQQFALKSFKTYEECKNPDFLTFIQSTAEREFERGQLLDHPNIIRVFDLFSYNSPSIQSKYYLVLQLVDGKTLSEISKGTLSSKQATDAAIQLINALRYARSLGFIHADLNEVNFMLDNRDQKIMLIDLASFYTVDEFLGVFQNFKGAHENCKKQSSKVDTRFPSMPSVPLKDPTNLSNQALYSFYFDQISEICIKILAKSELCREEKINMRIEIKKIAWNYAEDVEDSKFTSFDDCLEKLENIMITRHNL